MQVNNLDGVFLRYVSSVCDPVLFPGGQDAAFREFEFRERYVSSVCDLVSLSILLAITAPVKEAAASRPGETRNTAPLTVRPLTIFSMPSNPDCCASF